MRIVVLVKEVPDTYGPREIDTATGLLERTQGENVLDEIDERALEVALDYADGHDGTDVIALSMGRTGAETSLRKALAMGADEVVLVADPLLVGADLVTSAEVLAAAARRVGFDLILAGDRSTDGAGGALPAAVAEFLHIPHATNLGSIELTPTRVSGRRTTPGAVLEVAAELPAVVSITESLPDPRFPTLKNTLGSRRKPLTTWGVAELELDLEDASRAHSIVLEVVEQPARSAGITISDDADAGELLSDFLAGRGLL
jgi:electron transfer flavoprotein beta subunit